MEIVSHEVRCEGHINGKLSAGDLVKTFMENKVIQGIFSVCTITGQSYCSWKDRKLKKFAKSQNRAFHGK